MYKIKFFLEFFQFIGPSNIQIINEFKNRTNQHPNPFCRFGAFGFSQTDEDGITIEILRRLDLGPGTFCEFGVGNGSENNTLVLLAMGWRGSWIGGQDLCFDHVTSKRLKFVKKWITKDNILSLYKDNVGFDKNIDVLSLDLDGNDYHFIKILLENNVKPKLIIVEYNGLFLPNIDFVMDYDSDHVWNNDDYFGASLYSWNKLMSIFGYSLICCNAATGANAFFIQSEYRDAFPEVPNEIAKIYASPFHVLPKYNFNRHSLRTLEKITY